MQCFHIVVIGKVQGVFFRHHTKKMADQLNIEGWVKNLPQGEVEIMACGEKEPVTKFIDWCRHGPSMAHVANIRIEYLDLDSHFEKFEIIK